MIMEVAAVTAGTALAVFGVTLGMLALLVRVLRSVDRAARPDDDDPGTDGGGGGNCRPRPPAPPGSDPAWWPEFERQLAEHVAHAATVGR
jgi:hypothetical protein